MMKIMLLFLFCVVFLSCTLDHSNPLDPENSGIDAPSEITGINVTLTSQNHVNISWNSQQHSDGYFLYRSYSEDGQFDVLPDYNGQNSNFLDLETITNYNCWYKVSAYVIVESDSLEGIRSAPHTWNN